MRKAERVSPENPWGSTVSCLRKRAPGLCAGLPRGNVSGHSKIGERKMIFSRVAAGEQRGHKRVLLGYSGGRHYSRPADGWDGQIWSETCRGDHQKIRGLFGIRTLQRIRVGIADGAWDSQCQPRTICSVQLLHKCIFDCRLSRYSDCMLPQS